MVHGQGLGGAGADFIQPRIAHVVQQCCLPGRQLEQGQGGARTLARVDRDVERPLQAGVQSIEFLVQVLKRGACRQGQQACHDGFGCFAPMAMPAHAV